VSEHTPAIDFEHLPAPSEGFLVTHFITYETSLGPARSASARTVENA
jgi:hypothetical protein